MNEFIISSGYGVARNRRRAAALDNGEPVC